MGLQNWFRKTFTKNCNECLKLLELILDDEATDQDKEYFARHIDKCKRCYEHYNLEVAIRKVLKDKIENQPVPSDLVNSIKTQVRNNL